VTRLWEMMVANNRMYLVDPETGDKILLAKYYPSTGWYVFHEDLTAQLNAFLKASHTKHSADAGTMYGYRGFVLGLEVGETGDITFDVIEPLRPALGPNDPIDDDEERRIPFTSLAAKPQEEIDLFEPLLPPIGPHDRIDHDAEVRMTCVSVSAKKTI
jgi:hypothetical protein